MSATAGSASNVGSEGVLERSEVYYTLVIAWMGFATGEWALVPHPCACPIVSGPQVQKPRGGYDANIKLSRCSGFT
ncbi:hypothetical protein QF015_004033 [Paenarthrobacter sp. TE4293]